MNNINDTNPEEPTEHEPGPPRRPAHERGHHRVKQREHQTIQQMSDEPDDPSAIRISDKRSAQNHWHIHPGPPAELGRDEHSGQQDRANDSHPHQRTSDLSQKSLALLWVMVHTWVYGGTWSSETAVEHH
ncbi:MAG: hypothetical protein ABIQ73_19505 [Acidimicrobiales bacterium]